jgi:transcriptional antiterminator RfaH
LQQAKNRLQGKLLQIPGPLLAMQTSLAAIKSNRMNTAIPHTLLAPDLQAMDRWLVAYTKPRQESVALQQLEQQGFEVYLPLYKKFKKTETGPVAQFEPMFPRYILFRPGKPEQSIAAVRSTKGITSLVRFGFEPAMLAGEVVRIIRQYEQTQNHATIEELSDLRKGQKVRLKHTALCAVDGLVQSVSSKRVAVLLEILGRPVVLDLEHHQVNPVE